MHWLKRYLYDRISVDIISPTFPVNFWSRSSFCCLFPWQRIRAVPWEM